MNPQTRPFAYPTVSPLTPDTPATGAAAPTTVPLTPASSAAADLRWDHWAQKGRRDDDDLKDKARIVGAVFAIGIVVAIVAIWAIGLF